MNFRCFRAGTWACAVMGVLAGAIVSADAIAGDG